MSIRPFEYAALTALVAATVTAHPTEAFAQQPATYDYDSVTPGIQGPKAPQVANPDKRFVRTFQLAFTVLVPTIDLQAALPAGFTAIPTATNPKLAPLTLAFNFQEMEGLPSPLGPHHTLIVLHQASNTNVNPPRNESLILDNLRSTQASVDADNQVFGGGARLASFEWKLREKAGTLDIEVAIDLGDDNGADDKDGQLHVTAQCPAAINQRQTADPTPIPFRSVDGATALAAFHLSFQRDQQIVQSKRNLRMKAKDHRIELPGGPSLRISGVGSSFIVSRAQEVWIAFE